MYDDKRLKKHNGNKMIISMVSYFIIIVVMGVQLCTAIYTTLMGDDFSHALSVGHKGAPLGEYFGASIDFASRIYMNWQGTYFAMFLQGLLSPPNHSGVAQLRVIMFLNAFFTFGLGVVFLTYLFKHFLRDFSTDKAFLLSSITILSLSCFRFYSDVFYWFSGAVAYSIPLAFFFVTGVLFIDTWNKRNELSKLKSVIRILIATICGFLAAGGSLNIAMLGWYLLLVLCVDFYLDSKNEMNSSESIKRILPYIISVVIYSIGVFINGIAPGNYLRRSVYHEDKINPVRAIFQAVLSYIVELDRMTKSIVVLFLIVVFIIGIVSTDNKCGQKNTDENEENKVIGNPVCTIGKRIPQRVWYGSLLLIAPLFSIFPVSMGYSGGGIPLRCMFVINLFMIVALIYVAFVTGTWLSENWLTKDNKIPTVTILTVVLMVGYSAGTIRLAEIPLAKQAYFLVDGELKSYYNQCIELYNYLEEKASHGEKQIVLCDSPRSPEGFDGFSLSENPLDYNNTSIAAWYGFDSIVVEKKDSNE